MDSSWTGGKWRETCCPRRVINECCIDLHGIVEVSSCQSWAFQS
jgi:hypothetical protein